VDRGTQRLIDPALPDQGRRAAVTLDLDRPTPGLETLVEFGPQPPVVAPWHRAEPTRTALRQPGRSSLAPGHEHGHSERMESTMTAQPVVLTPEAIAALQVEPLGRSEGVTHRVLWRTATSMAGVLAVGPGRQLGKHAHRANHHHIWVLDGGATILGTELRAGSYVHIPSGVEHDIDASTTDGCRVFYLYLRQAESAPGHGSTTS
jgi:quercetin dioxygenase-like cupin family protein